MKNISDYVCTLEQAKRLKELGIEHGSLFYYFEENNFDTYISDQNYREDCAPQGEFVGATLYTYPAFTSQELGELIDEICSDWNQGKTNVSRDYKIIYSLNGCLMSKVECECDLAGNLSKVKRIVSSEGSESMILKDYKSEAQARAAFLIYLLDQRNEKTKT